jgi:hypothetical protein
MADRLDQFDRVLFPYREAWGAHFTGGDVNSPDFGVSMVASRTAELARCREAYSRKILERRVPRVLRWTLDHPRLLRRLLRVFPRWQPTTVTVPLGATMTVGAAVEASERWLQEQEARLRVLLDGYVFTYTDASGLPAEVYGP